MNTSDGVTIEKEYKWLVTKPETISRLKKQRQIDGFAVEEKEESLQKDFYFFYSLEEGSYLRVRHIKAGGRSEYLITCKEGETKGKGHLTRIQREFPITSEEFGRLISRPDEVYRSRALGELPVMKTWQQIRVPGLPLWVFNSRTRLTLSSGEKRGILCLDKVMFTHQLRQQFKPTDFEIEFEPLTSHGFKGLIQFIDKLPGVEPRAESKVGRWLRTRDKRK